MKGQSNKARNQIKGAREGARWFLKNVARRRAKNKVARMSRRINR